MFDKKSLKIPKGNSDSINHIRTDNATAKRKLTETEETVFLCSKEITWINLMMYN